MCDENLTAKLGTWKTCLAEVIIRRKKTLSSPAIKLRQKINC